MSTPPKSDQDTWNEELARRISDGEHIPWKELSGLSQSSIKAFQLLESIAQIYRQPDEVQPQILSVWGQLQVRAVIGTGSYGVVYRAFDPVLQREVALKLARGDGSQARRWIAEARRLSRVSHPSVLTVYGAEVHAGQAGIWFELLRGESLTHRVTSNGPLSAAETRHIGIQLCGALAAIHQAELVHGDVKSDNIFREKDGRIVLLDFGSMVERGGEQLTTGSPGYLAPEIHQGAAASVATDIYALGMTLSYLLTGITPNRGDLTTIINATFLLDQRPDTPANLASALGIACAEDPHRRPASAGGLLKLLGDPKSSNWMQIRLPRARWWLAALVLAMVGWVGYHRSLVPNAGTTTVAVLPFLVPGEEQRDQVFAAGIGEELVSQLGRSPQLRIIAHSSSSQISNTRENASEIGEALGASFLVGGSVRREDDRLRVAVRLIDVHNSTNLWTKVFSTHNESLFAIQSKIALDVAQALGASLNEYSSPTLNMAAWEAYLQGMELWRRKGEGPVRGAIELFESAVHRDPDFAEAWAALGEAWIVLPRYTQTNLDEYVAHAQTAAERAILLDPALPQPYLTLAAQQNRNGDHLAALELVETAFADNPHHNSVLNSLAFDYGRAGWVNDAVDHARHAAEVDPLEGGAYITLGFTQMSAGDLASAEQTFLTAWHRLGVKVYFVWHGIFELHLLKGDYTAAQGWMAKIPNAQYTALLNKVVVGLKYAASNPATSYSLDTPHGVAVVGVMSAFEQQLAPAAELFDYLLLLKEQDLAFDLAISALNSNQYFMPHHLYKPMAADLRQQPRIIKLARRLKLDLIWNDRKRLPDFCTQVTEYYDCWEQLRQP